MTAMIDLHCHLLPGIDDGARDLPAAIAMARQFVDDGVILVACTPHILPGLYQNTGPQIRAAVADLRTVLQAEGIPLEVLAGADNHIVPDFVDGIRRGHLLTLADTRYVLVEPPHHVLPGRMEETFFSLTLAGYVPILTHPERLSWIRDNYALILRLVGQGVWMQVTAGSLTGKFGRDAKYWAERLLGDGAVHILATDAHDPRNRLPELGRGRDLAARLVGHAEAQQLVYTRPLGVIQNCEPHVISPPLREQASDAHSRADRDGHAKAGQRHPSGGIGRRLRSLFDR